MSRHFTASLSSLYSGRVHTILTACFSHENLFHLGTNMLVTYFASSALLGVLSPRRFLGLYLLGGVGGVGAQLAANYYSAKNVRSSWRHMLNDRKMLGASASVNGTVMTYCALFPTSIIYLYFIVPVPAALFGVGYVAYDIYGAMNNRYGPVGHAGHLGGAVVGTLAGLAFRYRLLRKF